MGQTVSTNSVPIAVSTNGTSTSESILRAGRQGRSAHFFGRRRRKKPLCPRGCKARRGRTGGFVGGNWGVVFGCRDSAGGRFPLASPIGFADGLRTVPGIRAIFWVIGLTRPAGRGRGRQRVLGLDFWGLSPGIGAAGGFSLTGSSLRRITKASADSARKPRQDNRLGGIPCWRGFGPAAGTGRLRDAKGGRCRRWFAALVHACSCVRLSSLCGEESADHSIRWKGRDASCCCPNCPRCGLFRDSLG